MDYLIFNQDYFDIPFQDMPPPGNLIVCHYPHQGKSEPKVWIVVKVAPYDSDEHLETVGMFWEEKMAVFFANTLSTIPNGEN
jgi:hypothetical protein